MHLGIGFWKDFDGVWEGKWRQVGTKIDQKSMPNAKSDFLKNRALPAAGARFSRFWVSNLGVKINEKSIQKWNQNGKSDFLINRALAAAGAWSVRFWGSKLEAKTHQKTIKKWSQHGKASWHRFLMDFGGFWEASWEGKSSQEASKMASKKRWKNEGQQDGQKVATRGPNYQWPQGSGPSPITGS